MSISISHLSKTFGSTRVLHDISLNIPSGQLVALVGPSGSGKTTLLRLIAGLDSPDSTSGIIAFNGRDVSKISAKDRKVGMVFQQYALFQHMSVFENVAFGLRVKPRKFRPNQQEIKTRVEHLLKLVQLSHLSHRRPNQLSGGQRQRIALARALAVSPEVLLLDEPFGALDAKVRKDLRRWLRRFHEELSITTVFVTHDQEEALEIADLVVVMNHSRIEQVGSPQEVFDRPATPFVIEFLGHVNKLRSGMARITTRTKDDLYVRPHDIQILPQPDASPLQGQITHIFAAGASANLSLRRLGNNEPIEAEISRRELQELRLQKGQIVGLHFHHIRLFAQGKLSEIEQPPLPIPS